MGTQKECYCRSIIDFWGILNIDTTLLSENEVWSVPYEIEFLSILFLLFHVFFKYHIRDNFITWLNCILEDRMISNGKSFIEGLKLIKNQTKTNACILP